VSGLQWFRMYAEAVDDEKLGLLAFEDRWHYVAILCCKAKGLIDPSDEFMRAKVQRKLGLTQDEFDKAIARLARVRLIDPKTLEPLAWDKRQFTSDTSKERVRQYRERMKRNSNVTVTAQETDTDTDTETDSITNVMAPPEKTAKEEIWEAGKSLLQQSGVPTKQAGSFLGKLIKDHGEAAVLQAVRAAVVARPADASEYIVGACRMKPDRGKPLSVAAQYMGSLYRSTKKEDVVDEQSLIRRIG